MSDDTRPWPQAGRERMILPSPIGRIGTGAHDPEAELVASMDDQHVFMMGDNPALPRDRKSTRLNSSHIEPSRMPSSA